MEMRYPLTVVSEGSHTKYLYRCQEALRLLHNVFVQWKDKGIDITTYDGLPEAIKVAYPYTENIDRSVWKRFNDEEFIPRSEMLQEEILKYRKLHKESTRWNPDVMSVPKFERT